MCRLSARHRVTVGLISVTCNVSQAVYVHNNELSAVKGMSNRGFQSILLRVRRVLACHRATSPNQAVLDVIPFLPAFLLQVLRATTTPYSTVLCTSYSVLSQHFNIYRHPVTVVSCFFILPGCLHPLSSTSTISMSSLSNDVALPTCHAPSPH